MLIRPLKCTLFLYEGSILLKNVEIIFSLGRFIIQYFLSREQCINIILRTSKRVEEIVYKDFSVRCDPEIFKT